MTPHLIARLVRAVAVLRTACLVLTKAVRPSVRPRVRPGPLKPGHYPDARGWMGGSVLFADRRSEVLIWRCYVGVLTHRIRLALYQVRLVLLGPARPRSG